LQPQPHRPGAGSLTTGCHVSQSSRSGFLSTSARFAGRVVFRRSRSGVVWARRAVRAGDLPAPACLFVPCKSVGLALQVRAAARFLGWVAEVKPGNCCAVWASGPLSANCPPIACKVRLPAGVTASQARAELARANAALALGGA